MRFYINYFALWYYHITIIIQKKVTSNICKMFVEGLTLIDGFMVSFFSKLKPKTANYCCLTEGLILARSESTLAHVVMIMMMTVVVVMFMSVDYWLSSFVAFTVIFVFGTVPLALMILTMLVMPW